MIGLIQGANPSDGKSLDVIHIYGGAKLLRLENSPGYGLVLEDNPDLAVGIKLKEIIDTLKNEITRKAISTSGIVEVIYSDTLRGQADDRFRRMIAKSFPNAIFGRYSEVNLKAACLPAEFTDFISQLDEDSADN